MNRKTIAITLLISFLTAAGASAGVSNTARSSDPQAVLARTVLARAKAASGGDAWDGVTSFQLKTRVSTAGLSGTAEGWEDVEHGLYANSFSLGPIQGAEGYDGTSAWSKDPSGQIVVSDSGDAREGSVNESYRVARAWWYADRASRGPAAVSIHPDRTEEGRTFQVVAIHPQGGRPFEAWFDAATGLLDRTVETASNETRTVFYSDYRDVSGLKLPFRQHSTNGEARYDTIVEVDSVTVNPGIDLARFSPPTVKIEDVEIAGGDRATIPFDLINNHIFVDVMVDGKGPVRMIFDTGGANLVTAAVAQRLGLASDGAFQAQGVGEKSADVGLTRVRELRLGGVTLRDQSLYVLDLKDIDNVEGVEVGGIVGFELFKRLAVRIDYEGRKLTLTRPEAFKAPAGAAAIPFTFDERTPQVEGKLDGIPGRFTIDTGSRTVLDVNRPFVEGNGLVAKYGARVEAITGWGLGGPVRSAVATAGLLELGDVRDMRGVRGVRIERPVVHLSLQKKGALSDPYLAGNVGGGVLKHFTATFDYQGKVMYLEPKGQAAGGPGDGYDHYDRSGMWINQSRDGSGYEVVDVVAGGPAAEAGLKVGDTILTLDGQPAGETPVFEARNRLRDSAPGTPVRLAVRSGSQDRKLTLVLRDLI